MVEPSAYGGRSGALARECFEQWSPQGSGGDRCCDLIGRLALMATARSRVSVSRSERNHMEPGSVGPVMTGRRRLVLSLLVAVVAGTGCIAGADGGAPSAVTCHTQYRPDDENLVGAREPSVTVERADDHAPPERLEFATLILEVAFQGDAPEGRNVTVVVTTTDGEPIVRDLYQFTDGTELTNEFSGGHGFTGLQYVSHDGASLQVWCEPDDL